MRAVLVVGGVLLLSIALCLDLAHQNATPEIEKSIKEKIKEHIIWQPDSPTPVQERFRGISNQSSIYVKYYFHSITNLNDVRQGHPPRFTQLGPYTFLRHRRKLNVEFSIDNSTVEYNDFKYLIPVPDLTNGSLDDPITTLNIPLLGAIEAISARAPSTISSWIQIIARAVEAWGDPSIQGIFFTKSVAQLLFGYEDPLLHRLNHLLPSSLAINPTFSLVANATFSKHPNVVYTGVSPDGSLDSIAQFIRWHGVKEITSWKFPYIEPIRGTDGTQFKPGLTFKDALCVWVPQLFRSMKFIEEGIASNSADDDGQDEKERQHVHVQNIPVLRFRADRSQRNPDPRFFQEIQGLFNVTSPMALGVNPSPEIEKKGGIGPPLFVSLPGYCGVDARVADAIEGVHCEREEHDSYLDVEPTTGITLRAMKGLMLSSWYGRKYAAVDANIADDVFVPIFWGQERSEASTEQLNGFKEMLAARRWYVFLQRGARPIAGIVAVLGMMMCVGGVLANPGSARRDDDEEVGVVEADHEAEVDRLLGSPGNGRGKEAQE